MKKILKWGCGCLIGFVVLAVVAVIVFHFVMKPKWDDSYGIRYENLTYGSGEQNTYDLYLPHSGTNQKHSGLLLYVHGGSWTGGDKSHHHRECYKWVQQGYVTATMNYTLLSDKDNAGSVPLMLDEIEKCVESIVVKAGKEGYHIDQMAIAGTSAGGHLAMMYAYSHSHPLPVRFEAIKVGPADFDILFPYDENADKKDAERFIKVCTGKNFNLEGKGKAYIDSLKNVASPVTYINDSTALPAIFAYGEKDKLIVPGHYHRLTHIYDSIGAPYSLIVYPNSGHFLHADSDCTERYEQTLADYLRKYFGY